MSAVGFCCLSEEFEALLMIFDTKECTWAQRIIMWGKIRFNSEFKMAAYFFMLFLKLQHIASNHNQLIGLSVLWHNYVKLCKIMLNFVKQIVFTVIKNGRQIHNLGAIFKIRFIGF